MENTQYVTTVYDIKCNSMRQEWPEWRGGTSYMHSQKIKEKRDK